MLDSPPIPVPSPVGVLVVDERRMFRDGMQVALRDHRRLSVVAEAWDRASAIRARRLHAPEVVVIGLWRPEGERRATIRGLVDDGCDRIVFIDAEPDAGTLRSVVELGCLGYVTID